MQLYAGSDLSAQVDGMLAASLYNFRVQVNKLLSYYRIIYQIPQLI